MANIKTKEGLVKYVKGMVSEDRRLVVSMMESPNGLSEIRAVFCRDPKMDEFVKQQMVDKDWQQPQVLRVAGGVGGLLQIERRPKWYWPGRINALEQWLKEIDSDYAEIFGHDYCGHNFLNGAQTREAEVRRQRILDKQVGKYARKYGKVVGMNLSAVSDGAAYGLMEE